MMTTIVFLFFLFALGILSTGRSMAGGMQGEYTLRSAFSAILAFLCASMLLLTMFPT